MPHTGSTLHALGHSDQPATDPSRHSVRASRHAPSLETPRACRTPTCAPTRCRRTHDDTLVHHLRRALVTTISPLATFARQQRHVSTVAVTPRHQCEIG